ncbi:MAG: NPCBM/NEW2 domain-containing protein [Planctomycetes bacterium]|nr:NPCBM/NEW2 domain-containing protein [Planctomycetota bacterium]
MKLFNHEDTKSTKYTKAIYISVFLLLPAIVFATNIEVIDADNNRYEADNITFEKDQCLIYNDITPTAIAYSDIASITFHAPVTDMPKSPWRLTTFNWDVLMGTIVTGTAEGLVFNSPLLGSINLRLDVIRRIETTAHNLAIEDATPKEDAIYLLNGDKDNGAILSIDNEKLVLKSSLYGKQMTYKLNAIGCITPLSAPPKIEGGLIGGDPATYSRDGIIVLCRDGSRLIGKTNQWEPNHIRLAALYDFTYRIPLDAVNFIYFINNRYLYLSEIIPQSVKEYVNPNDPPDVFLWHYRNDLSVVDDKPISLKGKRYYKGLGVHANSELTYPLNKNDEMFYATIGLDDTSGPKASVQFSVYLDDNKVYESKVFKWADPPEEVAIPVKGAKTIGRQSEQNDLLPPIVGSNLLKQNCHTIKLVVTDAGDGYILDRACWANARITRNQR